jgi:hypothetical protein
MFARRKQRQPGSRPPDARARCHCRTTTLDRSLRRSFKPYEAASSPAVMPDGSGCDHRHHQGSRAATTGRWRMTPRPGRRCGRSATTARQTASTLGRAFRSPRAQMARRCSSRAAPGNPRASYTTTSRSCTRQRGDAGRWHRILGGARRHRLGDGTLARQPSTSSAIRNAVRACTSVRRGVQQPGLPLDPSGLLQVCCSWTRRLLPPLSVSMPAPPSTVKLPARARTTSSWAWASISSLPHASDDVRVISFRRRVAVASTSPSLPLASRHSVIAARSGRVTRSSDPAGSPPTRPWTFPSDFPFRR